MLLIQWQALGIGASCPSAGAFEVCFSHNSLCFPPSRSQWTHTMKHSTLTLHCALGVLLQPAMRSAESQETQHDFELAARTSSTRARASDAYHRFRREPLQPWNASTRVAACPVSGGLNCRGAVIESLTTSARGLSVDQHCHKRCSDGKTGFNQ
jgi:hypothetical protein